MRIGQVCQGHLDVYWPDLSGDVNVHAYCSQGIWMCMQRWRIVSGDLDVYAYCSQGMCMCMAQVFQGDLDVCWPGFSGSGCAYKGGELLQEKTLDLS